MTVSEITFSGLDTLKSLKAKIAAWNRHIMNWGDADFQAHRDFQTWLRGIDLAALIDSEIDFVDVNTPTMRKQLHGIYLRDRYGE